jgi:ABC-type glycerol-3-phosphate transport system substrate-binding protein
MIAALALSCTLVPAVSAHKAQTATNISFWISWPNQGLEKLVQQYNATQSNVHVNLQVYSAMGDDNQGKLLAAVAGHRAPDLVLSFDDVLAYWAGRGEIQPLDGVANNLGVKASAFAAHAWQSVNWHGHLYGVPVDWDPDAMLWYNKSVFKAVGLDPNKAPATWAELTADAAKIDQTQGGKITRVGIVAWAGGTSMPLSGRMSSVRICRTAQTRPSS